MDSTRKRRALRYYSSVSESASGTYFLTRTRTWSQTTSTSLLATAMVALAGLTLKSQACQCRGGVTVTFVVPRLLSQIRFQKTRGGLNVTTFGEPDWVRLLRSEPGPLLQRRSVLRYLAAR